MGLWGWICNVGWREGLTRSIEEPAGVSVHFLMVGICCVIAGPIESAVVIPDGHDVLLPGHHRLGLFEDLAHQNQKVLCWVAVYCAHFVAFLHGELFHKPFHHMVRIFVKLLEIVAEVSHDMITLEYALQKFILSVHIWNVRCFGLAN